MFPQQADNKTDSIQTPDSNQTSSLTYRFSTKDLSVVFKNGDTYVYRDVPEEKWNELKVADSKGRYLNQQIKPFYEYKKIQ